MTPEQIAALERLEDMFVTWARALSPHVANVIEDTLHQTLCVHRHDCTCRETKEIA